MTRPAPPPMPPMPPLPDVPESTVSELHALYREAVTDEPGPMLDRSILDAARAAVQADRSTRRPRPWWKGWLTATSAVAVAVVGLSVTWRVMDEQERHLREEMKAAEGVRESSGQTVARAAPAEGVAEGKPLRDARAPEAEKTRRVESTATKDVPASLPEPAANSPAAPAAMAPVLVEAAAKKSRRAESDELRERRDAGAAANFASGPARRTGKLEAQGLGISGSGATAEAALAKPSARSVPGTVAQPAADAATPDAWLKQIRELRAAGRSVEAAQSLARFRARYPDFVLPDDLLDLK